VEITPAHPFFVVASDGVFEFLSSQEVVDMVLLSFSSLFFFLFLPLFIDPCRLILVF